MTLDGGNKYKGWGTWIGHNIFGIGTDADASNIGNWFRNNSSLYRDNQFLQSLTDADLEAILNDFYTEQKDGYNFLGIGKRYSLDYDSINKYLSQLQNYDKILGEMPTAPDYEAIQKEAYNAINSENQELLGMLKQDLARQ